MNFYELITTAKTTPGKIDKQNLIRKFFIENADRKTPEQHTNMKLLEMYINPDLVCGFSKKMIEKAKEISHTPHQKDVVLICECLANRSLTGNNAIAVVGNAWLGWSEQERFTFEVIATKATVGFTLKSVNDIHKEMFGFPFVKVFECQLAEKYEKDKASKYKKYFFYSPKYDGLRSLFYSNCFHSRENKPFEGFEFIAEEAKIIADHFKLDLIDGEFFSPEIDFEEIQSAVMSKSEADKKQKELIRFNVFAVVNDEILRENTKKMIELMENIEKFIKEKELKYINIVPQKYIVNDPEEIHKRCEELVEAGYEGIMLRDPDVPYDFKRSRALMKYKLWIEDDFIITGYFEGEGKLANMLGGIYVRSRDGKIVSKVGTGFSEKMRKKLWEEREKLAGEIVEIKYWDFTENNSLRFPVFVKFKRDR